MALLIISTRQWFNSSISVWPRCVFLLVCPLLIIHSVCRDQCLLILAIDCVSVNLSVLKQPQNEKIICSVVTCFLCFCSLGNSLEWSTSALGVKLLHKSFCFTHGGCFCVIQQCLFDAGGGWKGIFAKCSTGGSYSYLLCAWSLFSWAIIKIENISKDDNHKFRKVSKNIMKGGMMEINNITPVMYADIVRGGGMNSH